MKFILMPLSNLASTYLQCFGLFYIFESIYHVYLFAPEVPNIKNKHKKAKPSRIISKHNKNINKTAKGLQVHKVLPHNKYHISNHYDNHYDEQMAKPT